MYQTLQYLKHCDEIVVFEDGGIVERGHHDELMDGNGYYKNMMDKFHYHTNPSIEKQSKWYQFRICLVTGPNDVLPLLSKPLG